MYLLFLNLTVKTALKSVDFWRSYWQKYVGSFFMAHDVDWWKFIAKWSIYGMSSLHFYWWNQFKLIPLACTLHITRQTQKVFCISRDITACYNVITMGVASWRHEQKGNRSFNKIMANWVVTQFAVMLLNDLSFPSPALATARIAALWAIATLATQRWR